MARNKYFTSPFYNRKRNQECPCLKMQRPMLNECYVISAVAYGEGCRTPDILCIFFENSDNQCALLANNKQLREPKLPYFFLLNACHKCLCESCLWHIGFHHHSNISITRKKFLVKKSLNQWQYNGLTWTLLSSPWFHLQVTDHSPDNSILGSTRITTNLTCKYIRFIYAWCKKCLLYECSMLP